MPAKKEGITDIAERKCKITGRVWKVEKVEPVKTGKGYRQKVLLHIPLQIDELTGRCIRQEQYYWIEIYSTDQKDKRFLDVGDLRSLVRCAVYLNSYHFVNPKEGLITGMKLSFIEWLKVDA